MGEGICTYNVRHLCNLQSWLRKAVAHEKLEQVKEALHAYNKSAEIEPQNPAVIEGLERCRAHLLVPEFPAGDKKGHKKKFNMGKYLGLSLPEVISTSIRYYHARE